MFLAGLGVGPTFSVFTIVVQNAVPFRELGVATSNLTFFRQIGGSVALAIVGTIFGATFPEQLAPQLVGRRRARPGRGGLHPGVAAAAGLQQTDRCRGSGRGDPRAASPAARPFIEPYIGIVTGIHQAFSLGVAQTFWIGVAAAVVAALAAVAIRS